MASSVKEPSLSKSDPSHLHHYWGLYSNKKRPGSSKPFWRSGHTRSTAIARASASCA